VTRVLKCPLSIVNSVLHWNVSVKQGKAFSNVFPKPTDTIQLPTDKRHIRVPQDRRIYHTHADDKIKQVFENILSV